MKEVSVKKFMNVPGNAIIYRNFTGKEGKYNKEGDRNFCLVIGDVDAEVLKEEGLNIKYEESRDRYILPIAVEYRKGRPPKIIQVTKKGKVLLSEKNVKDLDWDEIEKAHISINASPWSMPNGTSGIKAYLKKMYVILEEDDMDEMYEDLPEYGADGDEVPWEDDD